MDHFILTRFNIPLGQGGEEPGCNPDWLDHRIQLFKRWTLPSLRMQSYSRFRWLCFFSDRTPPEYLREAEKWGPAEVQLVPYCENPGLRWATFVRAASLAVTHRATSGWVATTRLDNDDAVAWDFVERIRQNLQEKQEWLRFPAGVIFEDPHYYRFSSGGPFLTLVEPATEARTPYCAQLGTSFDPLLAVAPIRLVESPALWCVVLHDRNLANYPGMLVTKEQVPLREIQERFKHSGLFRVELLNLLLQRRGLERYLEIGVYEGATFSKVLAKKKTGVDPSTRSAATVKTTSDAFFASNKKTFDLIFVDGLHHWETVLRDVDNALACLSPNGVIVLHDCMPVEREQQLRSPVKSAWHGAWTGDVWKAFTMLRARPNLDCVVLNCDWGLGIVLPRPNTQPIQCPPELTWEDYRDRRVELLRIVDIPGFWEFLDGPASDH